MDHINLLFDTGPGTMRRLLEAGVEIFDVSYVFYSHFHPDHTGELVPFIFATKYPDASKRKRPLSLVAGKGFINFFNGLKAVYGEWIELERGMLTLFEIENRDRFSRRFDDFQVETLPVNHSDESIAYRITDTHGASLVYSGDTDYTENLITLAREADLFICESAMPDDQKVKGHLSPSLAGRIASHAGVKKLVLTHLYPECDQVNIVAECRKTYQGPLIIAEDLLNIRL
jgi:ribonuclease BN (tRNA processing enzyme)